MEVDRSLAASVLKVGLLGALVGVKGTLDRLDSLDAGLERARNQNISSAVVKSEKRRGSEESSHESSHYAECSH